MFDHLEEKQMGPPLVDADWHVFCQAIYKGIGGVNWKSCTFTTQMSKAAGAKKKPRESQKAKALWSMKAAKDRREGIP